MPPEKSFDTEAELHGSLASRLILQYRKLDENELVRRANNPEATPVSRKVARMELDRRSASKEVQDSGAPDTAGPIRRGEATPLALLALAVMAMMTVALFWYDPQLGALMAMSTGMGFSFVFPNAGRIIGFGLVAISLWLGFEIFRNMPLYIALFLSLIPLTILGIGLNMVASSFAGD